jgi:hypothetical protein
MTARDAEILATGWVWQRFPVVPPINLVFEFSERELSKVKSQGMVRNIEEEDEVRGKWFVSFFCSWDTDSLGMPQTLNLLVDDKNGEIHPY